MCTNFGGRAKKVLHSERKHIIIFVSMLERGNDEQQIVRVNGQAYDAFTGQPIVEAREKSARAVADFTKVHSSTQKSRTLNRRFVKKVTVKPLRAPQTKAQVIAMEQFRRRMAVARQKNEEARMKILAAKKRAVIQPLSEKENLLGVERLATSAPTATPVEDVMEVAVAPNNVKYANEVLARKKAEVRHLSAAEMKDRAIAEAFERAAEANLQPIEPKKRRKMSIWRNRKFVSALSMCVAVVMLGGYLVYINVPNISIRVAAMRAGIDAAHPTYRPVGYSLNGLVSFRNNGVEMEFTDGENSFVLAQRRSSWDSATLLANYVRPNWGGDYTIVRENGLTIYLNNGNAAWVSGGILFTIEGTGLTDEQARSIAASL